MQKDLERKAYGRLKEWKNTARADQRRIPMRKPGA